MMGVLTVRVGIPSINSLPREGVTGSARGDGRRSGETLVRSINERLTAAAVRGRDASEHNRR